MTHVNSVILEILDEVETREAAAFVAEAHTAGDEIYQTMIQDAQKRIALRDQKNQEETAFLKNREVARHINKAALSVNEHKARLVEALIKAVHEELCDISEDGFVDLMVRSLDKQKTEERPRIHVPQKRFDLVVAEFGQSYQVIKDTSIQDGFILSYHHFDVNMELSQIIRHKKDVLIYKAMEVLFGGDYA